MTWDGLGMRPVMAVIVLAGYAAAAGLLAPAVLSRGWTTRLPRLAMLLWLLLSASWVAAVVLAILAMTVPASLSWPASHGLPAGGRHARDGLLAGPGGTAGHSLAAAGLVLAAAIVLRVAMCLASELARSRRECSEHAALIAAAGRIDEDLGVTVIDHGVAVVYCLPGRRHRIAVSAGALAALRPEQVRAVIAHERAHLRGRHHLTLAMAAALARAFPRVPLFARARPQLTVLAEMAADDAAARDHDRCELAEALVILARAGARPAALMAGGSAAIARVQRLLTPAPPARRTRLAAAAGLVLPALIVSLPLLMAACDLATR